MHVTYRSTSTFNDREIKTLIHASQHAISTLGGGLLYTGAQEMTIIRPAHYAGALSWGAGGIDQQISSWMTGNLLTLNSSKTEFLPGYWGQ